MLIYLFIDLMLLISPVSGEDTVVPDDAMVQSDYAVSVLPGISTDTVIIAHNIFNNNTIGIDSISLLINLPLASGLLDFQFAVPSGNAAANCLGPMKNYILPNSQAYIWTIKPAGDINEAIIEPSGRLEIVCTFSAPRAEELQLAPHASIIYFPEKTVYTVSDSVIIDGHDKSEYVENPQQNSEPNRLSVSVSPNPFNSSVRISFTGDGIKGQKLDFRVLDILGRTVHSRRAIVDSEGGEIVWSPANETATGIYFFRLSIDDNRVDGKLIFLK